MVQARIRVIRAAEHQDARRGSPPRPSRGSRGPCPAGRASNDCERLPAPRSTAKSFSSSVMPSSGPHVVEQLALAAACGSVKRERRIEVADAALGEEVGLLGERRLHDLGRARRRSGTTRCPCVSLTKVGTCVRIGKKMYLSGLLVSAVVVEEQVVDVRLRDLRRVAGIDRAVLAALDCHISSRGLVGEDDVLLLDAERLEVRAQERRRSSRC